MDDRIIGIGIDLIEVDRIKHAVTKRKSFLPRIYADAEVRLSDRGTLRFEELAGRFAVKESVLKALKTGWSKGVKFNEIIVLNEASGAPYVQLTGTVKKIADDLGIKKILVSISHTRELAVGMAIATGYYQGKE
jgi:holo-[acyl-carrier protein] synthase